MARKPKSIHGKATKQLVLDASAQIILRDGVEALNTNRVADRAGISVGSIYQYYSNKDEILLDLLMGVLTRRTEKVKQAVSASTLFKSSNEIISRIVDALFESDSAEDAKLELLLLPLALTSHLQSARDHAQRASETINPIVRTLILAKEPGLRNRDIDGVSFVLAQAVRGVMVGRALPQCQKIKEVVLKKELKNLLLGMIKGPKSL